MPDPDSGVARTAGGEGRRGVGGCEGGAVGGGLLWLAERGRGEAAAAAVCSSL